MVRGVRKKSWTRGGQGFAGLRILLTALRRCCWQKFQKFQKFPFLTPASCHAYIIAPIPPLHSLLQEESYTRSYFRYHTSSHTPSTPLIVPKIPSKRKVETMAVNATAKSQVALEFEPLFAELEAERSLADSIREKSKELDRCYRSVNSLLNSVHSTKGEQLEGIVAQTLPIWKETRAKVSELAQLVPEGGFYRVRTPTPFLSFQSVNSC